MSRRPVALPLTVAAGCTAGALLVLILAIVAEGPAVQLERVVLLAALVGGLASAFAVGHGRFGRRPGDLRVRKVQRAGRPRRGDDRGRADARSAPAPGPIVH